MTLRAQNWLNALDVGTPDADGWLPVCPLFDVSEAEVRAELARLGYATEDRAGQVCVKRDPPATVDPLATQAAALWTSPDCREAVAGVLAAVAAVAALGVDISDWSFQGVTAAAQAALASHPAEALHILAASVALRTAWDRVVYHIGDMRTADELWPYLYALAIAPA